MAWAYLLLAGAMECGFTTCLKLSDGLTRPWYTAGFLLLSLGSFALLTLAAQRIELGTAYAVWTGIGAAGTVAIGVVFFRESAGFWRLFFLTTLVASIVGLKLVSPPEQPPPAPAGDPAGPPP